MDLFYSTFFIVTGIFLISSIIIDLVVFKIRNKQLQISLISIFIVNIILFLLAFFTFPIFSQAMKIGSGNMFYESGPFGIFFKSVLAVLIKYFLFNMFKRIPDKGDFIIDLIIFNSIIVVILTATFHQNFEIAI